MIPRRGGTVLAILLSVGLPIAAQSPPRVAPDPALTALLEAVDTLDTSFRGLVSFESGVDLSTDRGGGPIHELGVRSNAAIAQLEAERDAADTDLRTARARRFPTVTADASAAWIGNPADPVSLEPGELGTIPLSSLNPVAADVSLPEDETTLFDGSPATRYELGLSIAQPIFRSGTIENAITAARGAERVAVARLEGERHAIRVRIGALTETVAILNRIETVLALQTSAANRLVRISEEAWTNGFITETVLLDAQLRRQDVALATAELRERRGSTIEELRVLAGDENLSAASIASSVPAAGGMPGDAGELVAAARTGNWELQAIGALATVREAQRRIAGGGRILRPEIGASIDLSWGGAIEDAGAATWEERGDWQVTLGVGISTTLFDGGRANAAYERTDAENLALAAQRTEAEREIARAIRTALLRTETLQTHLEHTLAVLAVRDREEADALAQLSAGIGGEEEVLRAMLDRLATVIDGYNRLAAYRAELWTLRGVLGEVP